MKYQGVHGSGVPAGASGVNASRKRNSYPSMSPSGRALTALRSSCSTVMSRAELPPGLLEIVIPMVAFLGLVWESGEPSRALSTFHHGGAR